MNRTMERTGERPVDRGLNLERLFASGWVGWTEMVLRSQGMPSDELRVVLTTADRELIRRHLELHLERLEEWLINQQRCLAAIERIPPKAAAWRDERGKVRAPSGPGCAMGRVCPGARRQSRTTCT